MSRRPLIRKLLASAAIAAAMALAGCDTDGIHMMPGRALAPLSEKMLAEFEQKNMDKESPLLVRLFKNEAELEVWKKDRGGQYARLKTYPICRWSGDLGPKIKEGDRQAPEGFYNITPGLMNPNSQYYLAFNLGFPNAYDQANGRTGKFLMVHGDCSSRGCYAMTDEQMSEIYALARESFNGGQKAFQVQAYPFRMTPTNMAKHRNSPHMAYWKMIKQGYDHFEVTRQEPKVDVCEKRYVFDATTSANASLPVAFNPRGKCPVFEVPQEIRDAVNEKKRQDEYQTAELIARGTPVAASRNGVDGGMNPVFLAKLEQGIGTTDAEGRMALATTTVPGTIPRHVNPPTAPVAAEPTTPAPIMVAANVPVPRPAPRAKEGKAPETATFTIASLISNIFSAPSAPATPAPSAAGETSNPDNSNAPTAQAVQPARAKPAAVTRTAALMPTKPQPKPKVTPPAPVAVASAHPPWPKPEAPAPKPAARTVVASAPAALSKPQAAPPAPHAIASIPAAKPKLEPAAKPPAPMTVASVPAVSPKPRVAPETSAAPAPQMRSAYAAPTASKVGLLAGAQPVIPVGAFASR